MYNTHDYRKMDVTRNLQTKETNRIFRTTLMYTADYDFSIILKSAFLTMNNAESRLQRIERWKEIVCCKWVLDSFNIAVDNFCVKKSRGSNKVLGLTEFVKFRN